VSNVTYVIMSKPYEIIAMLKPKPGSADRVRVKLTSYHEQTINAPQVEELLNIAANDVKANEPGTSRYHLQREVKGDAPTFLIFETYVIVRSLW
jgi:quinol monooxygenase YgiN